jgi:hypothetical protein
MHASVILRRKAVWWGNNSFLVARSTIIKLPTSILNLVKMGTAAKNLRNGGPVTDETALNRGSFGRSEIMEYGLSSLHFPESRKSSAQVSHATSEFPNHFAVVS